MEQQEVRELIQQLERKEANKEKLTVSELTILDVYRASKKEGKEISARTIEQIRFMMD